ncbi:MAG: glycoside hydrolase [Bacteroidales bacterium]|nr:glycoside hydrolase [Bacteroidales bacterium]
MKKLIFSSLLLSCVGMMHADSSAIRVNQVGYRPSDIKAAVLMLESPADAQVTVVNVATGAKVSPDSVVAVTPWDPMAECSRIYFSSLTEPGKYRIVTDNGVESPVFTIADDVFAGLQEMPLHYMRQQRCGYNPCLDSYCHQHDGLLVLSGKDDGKHVDVTGGWHDASDYLQYLTTSANAVFQMLFAYQENPSVWSDEYDAAGKKGSNGVPDILDEARWGLEWMIKMNPADTLFLNQIADDRDHRFYGLPADDNADYGWGPGKERPVYPCSGKPYGLKGNINDSKGLASSVGKFASSFTLGSQIFKDIDPAFAADMDRRAANAYEVAKANPGACQTAPCVSPYYYEEDNWVDDMELAAMMRYASTSDHRFHRDAVDFGRMEPVTPWMGADSAHHYQWYPFINLGHVMLARDGQTPKVRKEFIRNLRSGLERVQERADNAFLCGLPFIWCSNNLDVALVTQAMLYRQITGDNRFLELETAARDWLMGCNPWGKTMIVGLTPDCDSPVDPHSALSHVHDIPTTGGLVDGPVSAYIFNSLRGVHLEREDPYAAYQNATVVYHDDNADYSSNEPTMDGTASMTFFLGSLAAGK